MDTAPDIRRDPPPAADPADAMPYVAGYQTLHKIGSGGSAVVYLARQLSPDRLVALKVLRTAGLQHAEAAARFAEEARIVARLLHPGIVRLYDVGAASGPAHLAFEYVPGPTLARFAAATPQEPRAAAALVERVAVAVQYAHEQGVIHRDLKPANILLKAPECGPPSGVGASRRLADHMPRITDFGLAKALADSRVETLPGVAVGTAGYMAPEQAAGDRVHVGPWTDVYALGVILYELITGRTPSSARTRSRFWRPPGSARRRRPAGCVPTFPALWKQSA